MRGNDPLTTVQYIHNCYEYLSDICIVLRKGLKAMLILILDHKCSAYSSAAPNRMITINVIKVWANKRKSVLCLYKVVLLMPLAETIKELVNFILEGVDLLDHTSIFLLRTINHRVIPIRWLIVRKRNILVWSNRSTPSSMKLTNSFMVSARGISNTTSIFE